MIGLYDALNIALAFIVGGSWIMLSTFAADRFGGKIGGFIGGLPSTIVVAFFFIGLVIPPDEFSEATAVFPLICGFTGLFLAVFFVFSEQGFIKGLFIALAVWFILSGLTVILEFGNFIYAVIGYFGIFGFSLWMYKIKPPVSFQDKRNWVFSLPQVVGRGLFGGFMISFAVFISKTGGPLLGGIFAVFPAVFIATLIICYKSRELDFVRALSLPMFITGMITIFIYGVSVRYFYTFAGLAWGTVISYGIAMISAYIVYCYIARVKKTIGL